MTGIVAPEGGGFCFMSGSTPAGGVMTPPERLKSELVVPLAGGTVGVDGLSIPGRLLGSSAATATTPKPRIAAATTKEILRMWPPLMLLLEANTANASPGSFGAGISTFFIGGQDANSYANVG